METIKFNKYKLSEFSKAFGNFLLPDDISTMPENDLIDSYQYLSIKYHILGVCRDKQYDSEKDWKHLHIHCEELDKILTPEFTVAGWENNEYNPKGHKKHVSFHDGDSEWVNIISYDAYEGKDKIEMYAMHVYDSYSAVPSLYFYFK